MHTLEQEMLIIKGRLKGLQEKLKISHNENDVEGKLRVNKYSGRVKYYHITQPGDKSGKYIPKGEVEFARKLAQKDYDQKVLQVVEQKLKCIDQFVEKWSKDTIDEVYYKLHPEKQKMVVPVIETDDQFVEMWKSVQYKGKGFREDSPEIYTSNGERVRSKSEMIIADLLAKEKIPYRYECPLELERFGIVYPDFTVLDVNRRKEIYWEHLGMMDDSSYVEKALKKIEAYKRSGLFPGDGLILTQETKGFPLDQRSILRDIRHYFLK